MINKRKYWPALCAGIVLMLMMSVLTPMAPTVQAQTGPNPTPTAQPTSTTQNDMVSIQVPKSLWDLILAYIMGQGGSTSTTATATAAATTAPAVNATTGPTASAVTTGTGSTTDPLAGLKLNSTNPQTDAQGVCTDNAWAAGQLGLQVDNVKTTGYVNPYSQFADNCKWDNNTLLTPVDLFCQKPTQFCTVRLTSGEVFVYRGEPGFKKPGVTALTFRETDNYPDESPFKNGCYVLRYDQRYGSTRNPSYDTRPGNFDCPAPTGAIAGDPLSIVAPEFRGMAKYERLADGRWKGRTDGMIATIHHPGGNAYIDLWSSYVPPAGCTGTLVENGTTNRITCTSPAELFADEWTYSEGNPAVSTSNTTATITSTTTLAAPTTVATTSSFVCPVDMVCTPRATATPQATAQATAVTTQTATTVNAGTIVAAIIPSINERNKLDCLLNNDGSVSCSTTDNSNVSLDHQAGDAWIDLWTSYVPPKGCTGTPQGGGQRITCASKARFNVNTFTYHPGGGSGH